MAGESVTHLDTGRPMVVHRPDFKFTLANFFRATLYSTMATLKIGMDILAEEKVAIDSHGGLFKTPRGGAKVPGRRLQCPVTCMQTAGEGGPYGMALLAACRAKKAEEESPEYYLNTHVFANAQSTTVAPEQEDVEGFHAILPSTGSSWTWTGRRGSWSLSHLVWSTTI